MGRMLLPAGNGAGVSRYITMTPLVYVKNKALKQASLSAAQCLAAIPAPRQVDSGRFKLICAGHQGNLR